MRGIDPGSWQVTLLPLPKKFSRGKALGFCGGHPVGQAEIPRGNTVAGCWWPDGKPELLTLEGRQTVRAAHASGNVIPGHWSDKDGVSGAALWTLRDGKLAGEDLHDGAYPQTWAVATGGGAVIGMGKPPAKPNQFTPNVGLLWNGARKLTAVTAAAEIVLHATDGTRLAGNIRGRAMLWPSAGAAPIDLTPDKLQMAEVQALDGELQIGIAWKKFAARAGLWRGTAASYQDITPKGFQSGRAVDGAQGYQVGYIRKKDTVKSGGEGSDNRAVIWQSAADRWFDLNALLPAKKYNASVAWAIEVRGDVLQVCGTASRYEANHPGTPQEGHVVPVEHPVVWTARLA